MRWLALLLLAGCATAEPPSIVTTEHTTIVRVPVPVPCNVTVRKRPESVMPKPGADVAQNAAGMAADVRALRDPGQYLDELEAALRACTGESTP